MSRNKLVLSHVGYPFKKITVIHVHLQQVLKDHLLCYKHPLLL